VEAPDAQTVMAARDMGMSVAEYMAYIDTLAMEGYERQ